MNKDHLARFNTDLNLPEIYFLRSSKAIRKMSDYTNKVGAVDSINPLCEEEYEIMDSNVGMDFPTVCNFEI